MSDVNKIFVYGTLKQGECRASSWPRIPLQIEPATTAGLIYDLGAYPAMIPGAGIVLGEAWTIEPSGLAATLKVLDQIEGYADEPDDLYVRRTITCTLLSGATVEAQTYFYARTNWLSTREPMEPDEAGLQSWSSLRRT